MHKPRMIGITARRTDTSHLPDRSSVIHETVGNMNPAPAAFSLRTSPSTTSWVNTFRGTIEQTGVLEHVR
jgi:hypothetical protein